MSRLVERLMFIALGALIAIISYTLAGIQKDNTNPIVDIIRCRQIEVVNKNEKTAATLSASQEGGMLILYNKDTMPVITAHPNEQGGMISGINNNGRIGFTIASYQTGGNITVLSNRAKSTATIDATDTGGNIRTYDRDGKLTVIIQTDTNGNGRIQTLGRRYNVTGRLP